MEKVESKLRNRFGNSIDTPWQRFLSHVHFQFMDHGFLRILWTNFYQFSPNAFRSNQPSPRRLRKYKKLGIKQIILSNNIQEFAESWKPMLPKGLFNGIVDSSEVGVRKPDPEIFRIALLKAEIKPAQAIFLDDYPEHVNVARSMGIRGINVGANPLNALTELDEILKVF